MTLALTLALSPGERIRRIGNSRFEPLNLVAAEVTRRKALWLKTVRLVTSAATNGRFMGRGNSIKAPPLPGFLLPSSGGEGEKVNEIGRRLTCVDTNG